MQQDGMATTFFTDPLLLNYITEFLSIKECLQLSVLSKKVRFLLQDHFRSIILQNNLNLIPAKTPIHQMHFYFDRTLRIFKYCKQFEKEEIRKEKELEGRKEKEGEGRKEKELEGRKEKEGEGRKEKEGERKRRKLEDQQLPPAPRELIKATLEHPFKFRVVTQFEVGPVFAGCLDNKAKAQIFKTQHLIAQAESKEKAVYREQWEVKDMKCKGQRMVLVKQSGQVLMYEANKFSSEMEFVGSTVNWSRQVPVRCVHASYSYTLFELQAAHCSRNYYFKHVFNYNIDLAEGDSEGEGEFIYAIAMNMHTNAFFLVRVNAERLLSVAVGSKQIFMVNERHQALVVQFDNLQEGAKQLSSKFYHPLASKKITKVYSGYNFFFALERNIEYIEQWTCEEVALWLRKVGFSDFSKIAKAEKLDGKGLKGIERKYMENVLGLTKLNMQQKLKLCIQEVVQGKNEYDQVWVWGKNECGQLGITSANYIAQPQRIKMDFMESNDRIDRVFCGWSQSFIRTHRGKIYCSVMASERKKKKPVEGREQEELVFSDDQDFRREGNEEGYHFRNKRRKRTEDYQMGKYQEGKKGRAHHKKHEQEQRWEQSRYGKAFFVSCYKDYVFVVQCPVQHKFEPTKQKKLRTSKAIIDKIIWSDSLDQSEFKIGIIDKEMGTIEVTPQQIQAFDYKDTSVRYVKRNSLVVWDRHTKIDHL